MLLVGLMGAAGPGAMGAVMKALQPQVKGRADGADVARARILSMFTLAVGCACGARCLE